MLHFIYPSDTTTEFLLDIPQKISNKFGPKMVSLICIDPSEESYLKGLDEIRKIPIDSIVVFMGHGQPNRLWGAESDSFPKKALINQNEAKIFAGKYLFLLACDSNEFIKGSLGHSKIKNAIGFGSLPTGIDEVGHSRRLRDLGVNEKVIERFKLILVELITSSLCDMIEGTQSFSELSDNLMLRLNKMISKVVFENMKNNENRILSDLLCYMKSEIISI